MMRASTAIFAHLFSILGMVVCTTIAAEPGGVPPAVRTFLSNHCYDCHQGESAEAGLDLSSLEGRWDSSDEFAHWVRIFDRVRDGEMPPPDAGELPPEESQAFAAATGKWLRDEQREQWNRDGRVPARRLTNLQLERTLHDLLGIDIPLASLLPEEPRTEGFTTVAAGQSISHFHLEGHLAVVDAALEEAFRRAASPADERRRDFSARDVARTRSRSRTREPEMLDGAAVVWSSGLEFYGRLPATTARESGWYRFVVNASALNSPPQGGVWCTVRTGKGVSSAPLLAWVGAFEAAAEPRELTFEAWLPRGHMLEIRPGDATLKRARFSGGQVGTGEGEPQNVPGVAIHSVRMERIHRGPDNDWIRGALFGNIELREGRERGSREPASADPQADAARLMREFAEGAFRRPTGQEEIAPYVAAVQAALADGAPFVEALRGGYRALLCSPRFMYFHESPGRLDDYALASRLSYFLWNTMPDDELLGLAEAGRLSQPGVLHGQVERMLADPRGEGFMADFAEQWLDLSQIDFTQPDRKLFPQFDLIVQHTMLAETRAFLQEMLRDDRSVGELIDAEFTYLNSRLARYYDIDGVAGDELRRVSLSPEDHRGGVLTQGAILKVTANGTTTSPVIRGVWISERLLGEQVPPPPAGVPAIEPDIRGATSIREMLAKHRSDASCASCHVTIDPPGFALENFDPAGRWRDRYGAGQGRRGTGIAVDAGYELPDGRRFKNVEEYQALVLSDRAAIARGVAEKLLTYGTGGPIAFADREAIDAIVTESAASEFGLRSLLHEAIASPIFLNK